MDYTEQFIRLNCSLMSDYKMMKLNAEMKCMGIGLYIQMILFLRRQQEYKHDFNELDLLAEQWGATVENLQHLIKDFNLFVITEDGYFRCLYLDEVMGYQNKLSEQRAAAGSKGGRSSKKKTAQIAEKVITSTVLVAADKEADDEANNKENGAKCMKNTIEKSDDENIAENTIQYIDNECVDECSQASVKQNFIREEKNREEKKNNNNKEKERIAVVAELFRNIEFTPRWKRYINEAFPVRTQAATARMMSVLEESELHGAITTLSNSHGITENPAIAKTKSAKTEQNKVQRSSSRCSQNDISSCCIFLYFFSVSSNLISSSKPFTPSLKFFTPLPIPFISSGIFFPPKSNNTTMAMITISPVPKFPKNSNSFMIL